jgi:hypothetical protein
VSKGRKNRIMPFGIKRALYCAAGAVPVISAEKWYPQKGPRRGKQTTKPRSNIEAVSLLTPNNTSWFETKESHPVGEFFAGGGNSTSYRLHIRVLLPCSGSKIQNQNAEKHDMGQVEA